MTAARPPGSLIVIVADRAETTILDVLQRMPALPGCDPEVENVDDGSTDFTSALAEGFGPH